MIKKAALNKLARVKTASYYYAIMHEIHKREKEALLEKRGGWLPSGASLEGASSWIKKLWGKIPKWWANSGDDLTRNVTGSSEHMAAGGAGVAANKGGGGVKTISQPTGEAEKVINEAVNNGDDVFKLVGQQTDETGRLINEAVDNAEDATRLAAQNVDDVERTWGNLGSRWSEGIKKIPGGKYSLGYGLGATGLGSYFLGRWGATAANNAELTDTYNSGRAYERKRLQMNPAANPGAYYTTDGQGSFGGGGQAGNFSTVVECPYCSHKLYV